MTAVGIALERRVVRPAHVFPWHVHSSWSFAVVFGGVGYIRCQDGVDRAGAGAVTVLHPGESHDSWTHEREGLDYLVVSATEEAIATALGGGDVPRFTDRVMRDDVFAGAVRAAHTGVDRSLLLTVALTRLFRYRARGVPAGESVSLVTGLLRRHLDEHYADPVSLATLGRLAGVSPATVVRRFRADTGLAPHEYLLSRRIDAALSLLRKGLRVAEVAALTGFADQSHLHRHFRRIVGVTPGRFGKR